MTWTSIASDLTLDGVVGSYSPPPAAPMTYQPRRAAPERTGMGKLGAFVLGVGSAIITFVLFGPHAPSPEKAAAGAALWAAPDVAGPTESVKGGYPTEAPKAKAPNAEVPQAKLRYDSEPKVRQLAPAIKPSKPSKPAEPPDGGETQDGENLEKFRSMSRGI